uniref:Basic leucine zipper transcriptional factor ATF-like n=1 Tax=Bos taurus TaxID=9913 RepID=A0AAA9T7E9_BOVIN
RREAGRKEPSWRPLEDRQASPRLETESSCSDRLEVCALLRKEITHGFHGNPAPQTPERKSTSFLSNPLPSDCNGLEVLGPLDSSDDVRKVQRREKNRIAAQKSRQRQTQKADTLHLESEDLEKQNAALRKEIKQLTEEMKYFTSVLSSHEPLCSVLAPGAPSPPEVVYSTHAFHQPHVSSPRFQP